MLCRSSGPMPNEIVPDDVVKAHIVSEYGKALASVAERFLRYPDRMSQARSDDERAKIASDYAGILSRLVASYTIALAALEGDYVGNVPGPGIWFRLRYFIGRLWSMGFRKDD